MTTVNEQHLLTRAQRFDLDALAEIYDLYSPGLYAYAMRLLGDSSQADDCVAETFRRYLQALKAGKGPKHHLKAYLYRIAHNWITDQYRRQPLPSLSLEGDPPLPTDQHPEQEADERLEREQVRRALQCLTPEQRQVIMLKYVEGWENQAIAAALNKPVGAVKSLQHRALESLRRILLKPSGKDTSTEEEKYALGSVS